MDSRKISYTTYLTEKTGIDLSSSQVRRIFKGKKYSYIWAKYWLENKQKPIERAEFKEKLAEYLTRAREEPERLQVWFWDESGFSLRVIRRKNWGKKGKRKNVPGQRTALWSRSCDGSNQRIRPETGMLFCQKR